MILTTRLPKKIFKSHDKNFVRFDNSVGFKIDRKISKIIQVIKEGPDFFNLTNVFNLNEERFRKNFKIFKINF